jgi:hypothetical protein
VSNSIDWLAPQVQVIANRTKPAVCKLKSSVIFNPTSLNFTDAQGGQTFTVVLSSAPAGPMSYRLAGTNLLFDHCVVNFDENNWSTPQTVHMIPSYLSTVPSAQAIVVYAVFNGTTKGSMPVTRNVVPAVGASSSGDPHYAQFSGITVSQQKDIVNYLFKSDDFEVQALQQKCNAASSVYCNKAVSIRFGNSYYTYDTTNGQNLNNATTPIVGSDYISITFDGPTIPGFEYDPPTAAKPSYSFTIPDQTYVTIYPSLWTPGYGIYTNVVLWVNPSLAKRGSGAMGNINATGVQLIGSDGVIGNASVASDVTNFFNSWAVPDEFNFFLGNRKPMEPDMPFYHSCSAAGVLQRQQRKSEHHLLESYNGIWERVVEDLSSINNVTYTQAQIDSEVQACRAMFSGADLCQKLLSSDTLEEACVRDGLLAPGGVMMEHHFNVYLSECGSIASSLKSLNSTLALVEKLETKYGFVLDA